MVALKKKDLVTRRAHLVTALRIAAFRRLRDGDRRKPLDGARGGLLGSSLVLEPTDDEHDVFFLELSQALG